MKNSTFTGLSVLILIGTGAAYLYYRERHKAPASRPTPLLIATDPVTANINAADMIKAGLPLPAGFEPVPTAPMNGLQMISNRQLNTRSKNGVAGLGSIMSDVESIAKFSLTLTEGSILPFDKNITRKLGSQLKALPGMHNVNLVGPLKPKVSAPPASTPDPAIGTGGFTGTGNGLFQNAITAQILDAAPSLLMQYAGQPASILPLLIQGSVPDGGLTDPTTGLPSTPTSAGSAQTYGWPSVWTPVPGYSPWQYIADQPIGGAALTSAGMTVIPVVNPNQSPTGVALPTNVPKKSSLNPLVAIGTAVVAVPVFFLVGGK